MPEYDLESVAGVFDRSVAVFEEIVAELAGPVYAGVAPR
jgi:hypothetical protein